jgi:hypothetical protein
MVVTTLEVVTHGGTDHTEPVLSPAWRSGSDPSAHQVGGPLEPEQGRHRGQGPCHSCVLAV